MTPDELHDAIRATDLPMEHVRELQERVRAELDAANDACREAKSAGDVESLNRATERLDKAQASGREVSAELKAVGSTLDALEEIAEHMKHAPAVNYASVWAEAVESRMEVAKLRDVEPIDGVSKDWRAEMAAMIDAKSFYWSPMMVSVVKASSAALPGETIVDADLLPVRAGWWWFGGENAHLVVRGQNKFPRRVASLAWLLYPEGETQKIWVAAFSRDWPEINSRALHTVWNGWVHVGRQLNEIDAEFQSVHQLPDVGDLFELWRFLVAGLLFIRQRVLVGSPTVIGRGARKRVEKVTKETSLQIVHLRKAETLRGHIVERTNAEFACQWWVRGHWHQQPYKDGVRPKWIDPFIKGPSEAPMKAPTEKVFAVVR